MDRTLSCRAIIALAILGVFCATVAFGQVELTANGSLRGLRTDGQLMALKAGIRVVPPDGSKDGPVGGGRTVGGRYAKDGDVWVVTGDLSGRPGGPGGSGRRRTADYRVVYKQTASDTIIAEVEVNVTADTPMGGVNYVVTLPGADYVGSSAYLIEPVDTQIALATTQPAKPDLYCRASAKGVRVGCPRRHFEITFPAPQQMIIQDDRKRGNGDIELSFPLSQGNLAAGRHVRSTFSIRATGEVDKSPVKLVLDPSRPGRTYDGIGGNFRIQSPADAAHIQYNLDNLRVAWGRVAMPLDRWQRDEDADPVAAAAAGELDDAVREAMEMTETLAKRKIPIIVSAWSAPRWALGKNEGKDGQKRINPEKWDAVCKSIGGYLEYMKQHFGAEAEFFSFNEPDLGIDVLQSPQEHADAIKRLGAHFAARGLKTRMILGDTGNPVAPGFIEPALADPEAVKYIGAVSFHSWGSGTAEQYARFGDAARRLSVPLIIGEGGTDAMAYRGRNVFLEPWYALDEIAQYVEICRAAQPLSILHWQLTADFSVLTGGRDGQPLQPAQRFWQLKQLGMTNPGAVAVPITCDKGGVVACAFDDHGSFVVHLVNQGAARKAILSGIPAGAGALRVLVTDNRRGMKENGSLTIADRKAEVSLDSMSLTSVVVQVGTAEGAVPASPGAFR